MLDAGHAQLATAQADVPAGPKARIVAVLYDDVFQLLVPRDSPLQSFAGLRGGLIALAPNGGQFRSFLAVAEHFGLHEPDFRFVASLDRKRRGGWEPGRRRARRAEAFSIRRLEGSRWRLRRTRQLWGLKAALVPPILVAVPLVFPVSARVAFERGQRHGTAAWEACRRTGRWRVGRRLDTRIHRRARSASLDQYSPELYEESM